jgi:hypothetical protein
MHITPKHWNKSPHLSTQISTITDIEDFHDPNRRDDVMVEASQIGLVQEMNQVYPDNFDYEEHHSVVSRIIKEPAMLSKFEEEMQDEAITRIDHIDNRDVEFDYEDTEILRQTSSDITTRHQLKSYIENIIPDFTSYTFRDKNINHLGQIVQLVNYLLEPNEEEPDRNDIHAENIMHILLRRHSLMGLTDDPTPISYIIAKYWQLIETPTVSATFNNFFCFNSSLQTLT